MGVLGVFREYLVDCYKTTRHPSHEQWPMLNMSHYVDLAMVEVPVNASSQGEGEEAEVIAKEVHLIRSKNLLMYQCSQMQPKKV